jgi:hypothetical protein
MHLHGLGAQKSCPVAVQFLKAVAERGPWGSALSGAHEALLDQEAARGLGGLSAVRSAAANLLGSAASSVESALLDRGGEKMAHPTAPPPTATAANDRPLWLYTKLAEGGFEIAQV